MSFLSQTGVKRSSKQDKEGFIDPNMPQVIFYQGKRNSGKSVAKERAVEFYYDSGMTIADLWAARNHENWFWAHNNNCDLKWQTTMKILNALVDQETGVLDRQSLMKSVDMYNEDMFAFYINELLAEKCITANKTHIGLTKDGYYLAKDEPLHCHCNRAYPILAMVPNYVTISQESIDRYNKQYFWDYKEFQEYWNKTNEGKSGIPTPLSKEINYWKVEKPREWQKELVKVVHFTIPSPARKDLFLDQFARILMQGRDEHRIIVQNPSDFLSTDKFVTLATEIKALPQFSRQFLIDKTEEELGKPYYQWNKYEKSWAKLCIVLGELKTIAPSSKLSGETKAGDTKRALFDVIGEWRQFFLWLLGDYQNPQDLYPGVRYQADYIAIKRASPNLLGEDFSWIFPDIEDKRREMYHMNGVTDEILDTRPWEIDPAIHIKVSKKWPRVQNLPDDITIVTDIDNSWYYLKLSPLEHHHRHTKQKFENVFRLVMGFKDEITGLPLRDTETADDEDEERVTKEKSQKRESKKAIIERIDSMHNTQNMTFPEIAEELMGEDEWKKLNEKQKKNEVARIFQLYNRWKEKQVAQFNEEANKNKK